MDTRKLTNPVSFTKYFSLNYTLNHDSTSPYLRLFQFNKMT